MNATEAQKTRDAVAARSNSIRLRSQLKKGVPYNPTPLQAWRQAADDVAFNRPVKEKLVKLRSSQSASALGNGVFSYGNLHLSEFEVRIISNSLRRAISLSVYRAPLIDLDLTRCDIDVKKAGFLGKGLAGNTTIERLTLRCNDLTADGAELIIRGILESFALINSSDEYDEWGRRLDRYRGGREGTVLGGRKREGYRREDGQSVEASSEDARRQRDLDAQRRAAQVSPFIEETARHLVTGIGYAPVTPAGPDGTIPVRGLTAGGAVPDVGFNYNTSIRNGRYEEMMSSTEILSHTQKVFDTKLDLFTTNDQLRNMVRTDGGSSAAAQTLARNTRPGSSGVLTFHAMQIKTGLTKEELVGKSDQYFEKFLQHESRAKLTGIPTVLDGGASLTQSSIESADPTDPIIAKRHPYFHNPQNMYGLGGDLVPQGIYPGGLPNHPTTNDPKEEKIDSTSHETTTSIPLPPIEDDEEGPGIAYKPQFPEQSRLHPLKYLNLVSTLLTIGCDRVDSALDIKQIGSSDNRALDALADLISHPLCGLKNLNISKNRLSARCCEKLWVCLDLNNTLEVIGMHNTQAGPVVAAGFIAKALGLSVAHGRAALTDERLGIIHTPMKNGFESTLDRKAVEETTLGYFQGLSMGTGGKWDQKITEKKCIESNTSLQEKSPKKLSEMEKLLVNAKSVFNEHSTLFLDSTMHRSDIFEPPNQDRGSIVFGEQTSISASVMPGPSSILGWRSFASVPENQTRHGYDEEGKNASKKASPVFWERVRGITKLNLSSCVLGDVGILGISALLMAARRSDEVLRGRLRQKHKIAAESMKRWRESGGNEAGYLAAASKAAGVRGDARSINRIPLVGSKSLVAPDESHTNIALDSNFGMSSIFSSNSTADVTGTMLPAGSARAFAKQKSKLSDSINDPEKLLSTSGGPLMSFAGGADEDAEKMSVPFAKASGLSGLEWLKLRSNEIGPKAISILCRSLRTSLSLRILDLSHNPIGVIGSQSLADALAHPHCTLKELLVDSCKITNGGEDLSGAHSLLRSLYVNRSITKLSMKANTLVPQDLKFARAWEHQAITYSLKHLFGENRTLKVLDLRDNYIHKAGQMACAEAVASFPYIVPHATVVASILTRWLDDNLTRFHSRPPPGVIPVNFLNDTIGSQRRREKKSKMATPTKTVDVSNPTVNPVFIKPHFPTVEELLTRPPSTAPVASVFAALDSEEAIAVVAEADRRNHRGKVELDAMKDNTKLRHEARKIKKRKKKEGEELKLPDASVLLHAVQMAHQAERHETTFPNTADTDTSRAGTTVSLSSEQQRLREEREVAAIAAAVAASTPQRNPEVQKIIALGNLLAASKSGKGASLRALEFLQQSEPVWVKDHQEFVKQMQIEKERKKNADLQNELKPMTALSNSQRPASISTLVSESGVVDNIRYSRGNSTAMSMIFGSGDKDNPHVASHPHVSTSAPLETPKLKLMYPRVVFRGSTDHAEGRALARIIRDSTSRQINRKSQGSALSALSGLGSLSSSLSNALASAGTRLASSDVGSDSDQQKEENIDRSNLTTPPSPDISSSKPGTASSENAKISPTDRNMRSSSRKSKRTQASPEALTAVGRFINENIVPVADRDYVIVRGSRLSLEVAIPKLDFTRLSYYGGISPQNAFFDPQKGKDDVIEAFELRQKRLGIPPPFALPKTSKVLAENEDSENPLAPRKEENSINSINSIEGIERSLQTDNDVVLAAPRGAMQRQASLREILAVTSKASRKKAGQNSEDEPENKKQESDINKIDKDVSDISDISDIDGFSALEGVPPRLSEIFAASLREKQQAAEKQRRELEDADVLKQKENTRQRAIRKDAQRRKQKENHEKLRNARLGRFPPTTPAPTSLKSSQRDLELNVSGTEFRSSETIHTNDNNIASIKISAIENTEKDLLLPRNSLRDAALFLDSSIVSMSSSHILNLSKIDEVNINKDEEKEEKFVKDDDQLSATSSDSEQSESLVDRIGSQPSLRSLALDFKQSMQTLVTARTSNSRQSSKGLDETAIPLPLTSFTSLDHIATIDDTISKSKENEIETVNESNHVSDGFITASENSDNPISRSESDAEITLSNRHSSRQVPITNVSLISQPISNDRTSIIDIALTLPPRAPVSNSITVIRSGQVLSDSRARLDAMIAPRRLLEHTYDVGGPSGTSSSDDGDRAFSSIDDTFEQQSSGDEGPRVALSAPIFDDPRNHYDPVSADGFRRIIDSRGLVPINLRNLTTLPKPNSDTSIPSQGIAFNTTNQRDEILKAVPSYKSATRIKSRPGQYTKMDLAITTRKMVTPANAIPLISMRRGEMLRDALTTGASSLVHLRGNVIRLVFEFLGEERSVLC